MKYIVTLSHNGHDRETIAQFECMSDALLFLDGIEASFNRGSRSKDKKRLSVSVSDTSLYIYEVKENVDGI